MSLETCRCALQVTHDNPGPVVLPAALITMTIEAQKMIDSTSECQTRPLAMQTLDDFDEFFRSCPGMTFIFLAPGEVNTVYRSCCSLLLNACTQIWFNSGLDDEASLSKVDDDLF